MKIDNLEDIKRLKTQKEDRVEVINGGTFPADMPIERLLSAHDSKPQNPSIEANFVEPLFP